MHLSRSFLIEGHDLSNLIAELLSATGEAIEASADKQAGHIARALALIKQAVDAFGGFDLANAYEFTVAAYKQATQQETLPIDRKRKAQYRKRAREVIDGCGPCRFNRDTCGYTRCGSKLVF